MSSNYQMWLTHNGGRRRLRFPVLPETINIREGAANRSVSIQGLGEVVIKQDPNAVVIQFSSFFPGARFPGVQVRRLTSPSTLVNRITAWQKSEKPVQFMVTGTGINMFFVIEAFNYHERGGDIGTIHYDITLKEYKEVEVRRIRAALPAPSPAPARVDNRAPERTHTVVRGDTLWAIAQRHLGAGARWPEIHRLNTNIVRNPNLIFPGQVLRLPS